MWALRVEYAEQRNKYDGLLLMLSLFFCETMNHEYVRVHAIYKVHICGVRHSFSCACATGIREYLFNT